MRIIEISCGVAIAASLLFGGATQKGSASDAIVQAACLPLLFFIAPEIWKLLRGRSWVAILLGLVVASPLLQLIPLPPSVWSALPGRDAVVETYQVAGLDLPWLGISVSPWATTRVAFSLLPPVAIFLGVLACQRDERLRLWMLMLLIGIASVFLDIAQIIEGPESPLRFYSFTSKVVGVGFFANRNHHAAFLFSLIPFAAFVFCGSDRSRSTFRLAGLYSVCLALLLGLVMTGSRSALGLGLAACIATYALILNDCFIGPRRDRMSTYIGTIGALIGASLLAVSFGLPNIVDRFRGDEFVSDLRWTIARVSFDAAKAFFPFGSGLGTFDRAYPSFQPTNTIFPAIVNHVHNDLLEVMFESGFVGILIIVGWLTLTIVFAVGNLRENNAEIKKERFAALTVISLLFVHSLWDYPLRTSAIAALFAACCAILVVQVNSAARRDAERLRGSFSVRPS